MWNADTVWQNLTGVDQRALSPNPVEHKRRAKKGFRFPPNPAKTCRIPSNASKSSLFLPNPAIRIPDRIPSRLQFRKGRVPSNPVACPFGRVCEISMRSINAKGFGLSPPFSTAFWAPPNCQFWAMQSITGKDAHGWRERCMARARRQYVGPPASIKALFLATELLIQN